ncbi:MAG TPA: class II aldolase/adducin family protein [Phycisphaerales bacterium]|nr:class II aldolase/adducin family protein [Phycisphaerales bacterium]
MLDSLCEKTSAFVAACHRAGRFGLLGYSSGNMSCRLGNGYVALSASGAWLGEIRSEQVAVCTLADARSVNGVKPTVETGIHLGILRGREDVNVVLHFQSPYATVLACGVQLPERFDVIPEVPYYIGPVGVVEYLRPGSRELADAVVAAAHEHDLVILRNHGQVVLGKDYNDAIAKAGFFELACRVLVLRERPAYIGPAGDLGAVDTAVKI